MTDATASSTLRLLLESPTGNPAADLDRSLGLLREVAAGRHEPFLRVYRPAPTLAFGQRDTRLPGYEAAREAALAHGFAPVVRSAGGRAAAYHEGCLIIDQVQAHPEAMAGHRARFIEFGDLYAQALVSLGVDAGVGELPGEYCPGEYSVHGTPANGAAAVKLVGTAQRVVAGAWLFSSMVVVEDSAPLRAVTEAVYAALGMDLDPATVGAAAELLAPRALTFSPHDAAQAVMTTWAEHGYVVG